MAKKRSVHLLKAAIGVLLMPMCWAGFQALGLVFANSRGMDVVWVPLIAGVICWGAIYRLMPEPIWVYVLGHEFTHALWAWLFGGQVKKIKVTSKGGHVVVSKTNFLITLAPYFFPFYAVIAAFGYWLGNQIWGWRAYEAVFLVVLGATYAFHATMTISVLRVRQPDIVQEGWLFSAAVIVLGNLTVLLLSVPLLAGGPVFKGLALWARGTVDIWRWLLSVPYR